MQFDPDGHVIDEIAVPVRQPSNCKFRDTDKRLYITSASDGLEITSESNAYCGHTLSCCVEFDE